VPSPIGRSLPLRQYFSEDERAAHSKEAELSAVAWMRETVVRSSHIARLRVVPMNVWASVILAFSLSAIAHAPTSVPSYYSDFNAFWGRPEIQALKMPYVDFAFEYPPLSGLVLYTSMLTSQMKSVTVWYLSYLVWLAVFTVLLAYGSCKLCELTGADKSKVVTRVFLTGSMITYLVYNFDVILAALLTLALCAFLVNRKKLSAVLLGLGIATKLFPIMVLPIFLKQLGRKREVLAYVIICGATIACFYLPIALLSFDALWRMLTLTFEGGPENTWLVFFLDYPPFTLMRYVSMAIWLVALAHALTAKGRSLVERAYMMAGGFLFGSWVFTPQMALWLLPFFACLNILPQLAFTIFDLSNAAIMLFFFQFSNQFAPTSPIQWINLVRVAMLAVSLAPLFTGKSTKQLVEWLKAPVTQSILQ